MKKPLSYFLFLLIYIVNLDAKEICPEKCTDDDQKCITNQLWQLLYDQNKPEKCLELALPLAKKGNATAQFFVGKIYSERGKIKKGINWYKKAAQQKHLGALGNVGVYYADKYDVTKLKKHLNKAIEYYKKATALGNLLAKSNLGEAYILNGQFDEAEECLHDAFDNDNFLEASLNLSELYRQSNYKKKNNIIAVMYMMIAKLVVYNNYDFASYATLKARLNIEKEISTLKNLVSAEEFFKGTKKAEQWIYHNPKEFLTMPAIQKNVLKYFHSSKQKDDLKNSNISK